MIVGGGDAGLFPAVFPPVGWFGWVRSVDGDEPVPELPPVVPVELLVTVELPLVLPDVLPVLPVEFEVLPELVVPELGLLAELLVLGWVLIGVALLELGAELPPPPPQAARSREALNTSAAVRGLRKFVDIIFHA